VIRAEAHALRREPPLCHGGAMRRRILPSILAVGALVLALAGCVRVQADMTLNPDNTVDGSIVVAVVVSDDTPESRATALTQARDIESQLLGALRDAAGVSTSEYEEDGYLGSRITFDDVALDAFSGQKPESFKFARDGDQYVFTGVLDFSAQSLSPDENSSDDDLTVEVTFPGEVAEHNGDLDGTTVSWSTRLDQRLEMTARGAASPPGAPVLILVLVGLGVLVVAAAVVAVLLFLRSRKKKAAAVAAPEPTTDAAPAEIEAGEEPPSAVE